MFVDLRSYYAVVILPNQNFIPLVYNIQYIGGGFFKVTLYNSNQFNPVFCFLSKHQGQAGLDVSIN